MPSAAQLDSIAGLEGIMNRLTFLRLCALIASLAGCGSDSTGPESTYARVAGTYAGPVTGSTPYGELAGTLVLVLTQDGKSLGGSYVLTATLASTAGPESLDVHGPIIGALELTGESALLTLSLYQPGCGTHGYSAPGGFDGPAQRLWLYSATFLVCGLSGRELSINEATFSRQ